VTFHLTYTTSLTCKSKLEVVLFSNFDNTMPKPPPLDVTTLTPPPSHAKASWRWFHFHILMTPCAHHLLSTTPRSHHLPCMQKRARGGSIFTFQQHHTHTTSFRHRHAHTTYLPCMQKRAGGGSIFTYDTTPTPPPFNDTMLISPPSHSKASWRLFLFIF